MQKNNDIINIINIIRIISFWAPVLSPHSRIILSLIVSPSLLRIYSKRQSFRRQIYKDLDRNLFQPSETNRRSNIRFYYLL